MEKNLILYQNLVAFHFFNNNPLNDVFMKAVTINKKLLLF